MPSVYGETRVEDSSISRHPLEGRPQLRLCLALSVCLPPYPSEAEGTESRAAIPRGVVPRPESVVPRVVPRHSALLRASCSDSRPSSTSHPRARPPPRRLGTHFSLARHQQCGAAPCLQGAKSKAALAGGSYAVSVEAPAAAQPSPPAASPSSCTSSRARRQALHESVRRRL